VITSTRVEAFPENRSQKGKPKRQHYDQANQKTDRQNAMYPPCPQNAQFFANAARRNPFSEYKRETKNNLIHSDGAYQGNYAETCYEDSVQKPYRESDQNAYRESLCRVSGISIHQYAENDVCRRNCISY
jgi:hypothetical protein